MDKKSVWKTEYDSYDKDQQLELRKGMDSGVDIERYDNPEYLAIQMQQLRLGLEQGLDISVYSDPEYDWFQMEEIRKGLIDKVDISKFADKSISFDRMCQVREGLKRGIDLSHLVHLEAPILRQLRMALRSRVDITPFINLGYDAEQLDEIRMALENGVDIAPYLVKEMRGVAISQIRLGLERGIPVEEYAKICYSWNQMRELRLGIEKRLKIEQYSNPMYSWQQMRELRLGLEYGLDISSYKSFVFTARDMERKRNELISGMDNSLLDYEQFRFENIRLRISPDGQEVRLKLTNDGGSISVAKVLGVLARKNIKYGIMRNEIEKVVTGKLFNKYFLIARGTPCVNGQDGYYKYYFDVSDIGKTEQKEDGSVDYSNTKWIELVEKNQIIAKYHAATDGNDGMDVYGEVIKAVRGREMPILSGENVQLLDDAMTYIALETGSVSLDEEKNLLSVTKTFVLEEANQNTGTVMSDGNIYIKGNVEYGCKIRAARNVIIDGMVGVVDIICGGNLYIKAGVKAMEQGKIYAGGDIVSNFFESAIVKSHGSITTNFCFNSRIEAFENVLITGKDGVIIGGSVKAGKGIDVYNVGNKVMRRTEIALETPEEIKQKAIDLEQLTNKVKGEINLLRNSEEKIKSAYAPEVRNSMEIYIKIQAALVTKEDELNDLAKKKEELDNQIAMFEDAVITVRANIYEGVDVLAAGLKWESSGNFGVEIKAVRNRLCVNKL